MPNHKVYVKRRGAKGGPALAPLLKRSVIATLEFEGFPYPAEVNVLLTDDEGIRELNRNFRDMDSPTDVLSFPLIEFLQGRTEVDPMDIDPETGLAVLGDIVVSLERAGAQATEYGHSLEREVSYLTVHSTLHLMGYDHINDTDKLIMRVHEEAVMKKLSLER